MWFIKLRVLNSLCLCLFTDIDDCHDNSCYPGVECMDLSAPDRGFKCGICPEGYIGDGKNCHKQEGIYICI